MNNRRNLEKLPVVRDYMDRRVATLRPETDILDAVGLLLAKRVIGASVVDKSGRLVGILTEKDCQFNCYSSLGSKQRLR